MKKNRRINDIKESEGVDKLPKTYINKSLSHATLNTYHLLDTFLQFLRVNSDVPFEVQEKANGIQAEVDGLDRDDSGNYLGDDATTADEILNETVFDLLDSIAPDGTHFSAHEGNGSDFGFWVNEEDNMNESVTSKDYTTVFKHYGEITVPKGTKITHKTAVGDRPDINFVDEFGWIDKNYPEIANILKMDAKSYGIDVPADYVTENINENEKNVWGSQLIISKNIKESLIPERLPSLRQFINEKKGLKANENFEVKELPADYWDYIEANLPDYHRNGDVLLSDILTKYIDGEEVDPEDIEMLKSEHEVTTKEQAEKVRDDIDKNLYQKAMAAKMAKSKDTKRKSDVALASDDDLLHDYEVYSKDIKKLNMADLMIMSQIKDEIKKRGLKVNESKLPERLPMFENFIATRKKNVSEGTEITTTEDINSSKDAEEYLMADDQKHSWISDPVIVLRANGFAYKFNNDGGKLTFANRNSIK